jgi:ubiquitin-like modifier-activating enzyme ATG7
MYLASFLALTYADLKKHKFYYWFSFPALLPTSPWVITDTSKPKVIKDIFSKVEVNIACLDPFIIQQFLTFA